MTIAGLHPPPLSSSPRSSTATGVDPQWTPDSLSCPPSSSDASSLDASSKYPLMDAACTKAQSFRATDLITAVCVVPLAAPLHAASQPSSEASAGSDRVRAPFTICAIPQTVAAPPALAPDGNASPAGPDALALWRGALHLVDLSAQTRRTAGESYEVRPLFALLATHQVDCRTAQGARDGTDGAEGAEAGALIVAADASDEEWTAMGAAWNDGKGCEGDGEEWDRVASHVKEQTLQLLTDYGFTAADLTIPGSPRRRQQHAGQIIATAHRQWCLLPSSLLPPSPHATSPLPPSDPDLPALSPPPPLISHQARSGGSKARQWEFPGSSGAGMGGKSARTLLLAACCVGLDARHIRTDSFAADHPSPLSCPPSDLPSPVPPSAQESDDGRRRPRFSIEVPSSPRPEPGRASPGLRLGRLLSPVCSLGGNWFAVPRLASSQARQVGGGAGGEKSGGWARQELAGERAGRGAEGGAGENGVKRIEEKSGVETKDEARGEEEEEEGGEREVGPSQTTRSLQRSASRRGQTGKTRSAGQAKAKSGSRGAKVAAASTAGASFRVYIDTGKGAGDGKSKQGVGEEARGLSRQNSVVGGKAAQQERGVRYYRQASRRDRGAEEQGRAHECERGLERSAQGEREEDAEAEDFRRAYSAPRGERSLERNRSMRREKETGEADGRRGGGGEGVCRAVREGEARGSGRVGGSKRREEGSGERGAREAEGELQRSLTLPNRPAVSQNGRSRSYREKGQGIDGEWKEERESEAEIEAERAERLRQQLQQQKARLKRESSGRQQEARSGTDEQAAVLATRGRELLRLASLPRQQDAQGAQGKAGAGRRGVRAVGPSATPRLRRLGRDGSFRVHLDLSPRPSDAPLAAASATAAAAAAPDASAAATDGGRLLPQRLQRAVTHTGASQEGAVGASGNVGADSGRMDGSGSTQGHMRRAVTHTGASEERVVNECGGEVAEREERLQEAVGAVQEERERGAADAAAAAARRRVLVIDIPDKGDLYPAPLTAPACSQQPSPSATTPPSCLSPWRLTNPPPPAPSSARAPDSVRTPSGPGDWSFGSNRRRRGEGGGKGKGGNTASAGNTPTSAMIAPIPMAAPALKSSTPVSISRTPKPSSKPSPRTPTFHAPLQPVHVNPPTAHPSHTPMHPPPTGPQLASPSPAPAHLFPPSCTAPSAPLAPCVPRIQPARSLPPIREGMVLQGLLGGQQRSPRGTEHMPLSASAGLSAVGTATGGMWGGTGAGREEGALPVQQQQQHQQQQQQQHQQQQQPQHKQPQQQQHQNGWAQNGWVEGGGQSVQAEQHSWQQRELGHPDMQQRVVVQPDMQQQFQSYVHNQFQPAVTHQQLQQHYFQLQQQQFQQPRQQAGFGSEQGRQQQWQEQRLQQGASIRQEEGPQPSLAHSRSFNHQSQQQQQQQQQGGWQQSSGGAVPVAVPVAVAVAAERRVALRREVPQQAPASNPTQPQPRSQQAHTRAGTSFKGPMQQRAQGAVGMAMVGSRGASGRAQQAVAEVSMVSPRGEDPSLSRLLSWNSGTNSFTTAVRA